MSTKKTAINKRDKVCPLKESVFWTANKSILSVMLSIINILRQRRVLIIKKQKQGVIKRTKGWKLQLWKEG